MFSKKGPLDIVNPVLIPATNLQQKGYTCIKLIELEATLAITQILLNHLKRFPWLGLKCPGESLASQPKNCGEKQGSLKSA